VVEEEGFTVRLPEASTVPMPPSIVTSVAFVARHEIVDDWPASIAAGKAVSEMLGAGDGGAVSTGGIGGAETGGGPATLFAHPVPITAMPTSRIAMTASGTRDFLI
jgi:hypothetical protein